MATKMTVRIVNLPCSKKEIAKLIASFQADFPEIEIIVDELVEYKTANELWPVDIAMDYLANSVCGEHSEHLAYYQGTFAHTTSKGKGGKSKIRAPRKL